MNDERKTNVFTSSFIVPRSSFQRGAIPVGEVCAGLVGALEEIKKRALRIVGRAHGIVGEDELVEVAAVEGRGGARGRFLETCGLRRGVGVEGGKVYGRAE